MDKASDLLREHSYDGIQEYDNPLPGWWTWLFIATIAFSVHYALYYHVGAPGRSIHEEFEEAVAENLRRQFSEIGELSLDEETIGRYMHGGKWLLVGQSVFQANCVSCHGAQGQGLVGPNLTDDYYKNATTLEDVGKVIRDGAAGQAMPAWKNRLHPNELVLVASYVASLRGQNLPGPRGAEGKLIPPWPRFEPPQTPSETPSESR